jgi:hypothetical protein
LALDVKKYNIVFAMGDYHMRSPNRGPFKHIEIAGEYTNYANTTDGSENKATSCNLSKIEKNSACRYDEEAAFFAFNFPSTAFHRATDWSFVHRGPGV